NGGTLTVPQIQRTAATGNTGIFNFNGGSLVAAKANTTFMQGLSSANVKAGGANINDGGFAITIGQPLLSGAASDGGLAKTGAGTLTLGGASTYNGPTSITAGSVLLSGTGSINGSSGITVNGSGAKFVQTSSVASTPSVTVTSG